MKSLRPRIIPVLLLKGTGLYKTVRFKNPVYIGDPINTVKIFNEKEVDEIVLLDIGATVNGAEPNYEKIGEIASEAFMPMAYGGAVRNVDQAKRILASGYEKVVLNSAAVESPEIISALASAVGSQSVTISLDVKRNFFGSYQLAWRNGEKTRKGSVIEFAQEFERLGAGEIMVHFVDRDGLMCGYDCDFLHDICCAVTVPVIVCGGAGCIDDLALGLKSGASAVAAGSMFVLQGRHRAVLISYPNSEQIDHLVGIYNGLPDKNS